ncbi:MAG: PepSY-associated TM helix domain-containing protein [Bacteroidetes bacterium]|nr:PepSY-associated TM helix domain-containing protein [Bacteroidota bacterium]
MTASQRIRKWIRAIHRDLGYFFAGMTVIYAISGIALNHIKEWDPNYHITRKDVNVEPFAQEGFTRDAALSLLSVFDERDTYKNHYFPEPGVLKIFLDGGSLTVDAASGSGLLEHSRRRAVFFETNFLHYNSPKKLWTWFADLFAGALVVIAMTGIFIQKGKNGITGRGAWLVAIGLLIPAIFLVLYL